MPDFATSFTTGSIQGNKNSALRIFTEAGDTQSLHFWSNFDPFFLLKIAEIKNKKKEKKKKKEFWRKKFSHWAIQKFQNQDVPLLPFKMENRITFCTF